MASIIPSSAFASTSKFWARILIAWWWKELTCILSLSGYILEYNEFFTILIECFGLHNSEESYLWVLTSIGISDKSWYKLPPKATLIICKPLHIPSIGIFFS